MSSYSDVVLLLETVQFSQIFTHQSIDAIDVTSVTLNRLKAVLMQLLSHDAD